MYVAGIAFWGKDWKCKMINAHFVKRLLQKFWSLAIRTTRWRKISKLYVIHSMIYTSRMWFVKILYSSILDSIAKPAKKIRESFPLYKLLRHIWIKHIMSTIVNYVFRTSQYCCLNKSFSNGEIIISIRKLIILLAIFVMIKSFTIRMRSIVIIVSSIIIVMYAKNWERSKTIQRQGCLSIEFMRISTV